MTIEPMTRATSASLVSRWLGLVGWIAVVAVAAAAGSIASLDAGRFYATLDRPAWAPPGWIFGPVWTVLYVAMAVAAWLVWKERGWRGARAALTLFCVQLVANAAWSWLFFAWHRGGAALVDLVIMWILVVMTTISFYRVRVAAGLLMVPYLAWVTFAGFLNYAVWQRNPGLL